MQNLMRIYSNLPVKLLVLSFFLYPLLFSFSGCSDYTKEVPKLIKALKSKDSTTRSQAALRLGRIGPPHANPAVRTLVPLLYDKNMGVQTSAAYALRSIGTNEAKKALAKKQKK